MVDIIFREYDIRGIVGEELHIDMMYDLACAIAVYFLKRNTQTQCVAVGMDVRTHSPHIAQEVCKAFIASGFNVYFIGVCTSPMLYFAMHTLDVQAGVMITASHNPKEYNGIKICVGTECIWGKEIQEIKHLYYKKEKVATRIQGTCKNYDIKESYITWLYEQFKHLVGLEIPFIVDCGNGAASVVMPAIIQKMEWSQAQCLYAEPDGTFPHHEADPIVEKNMQDLRVAMQQSNAVLGIGFDGDADRMGAMTHTGELVSGDKMLALFADSMIASVPNLRVVFDITASAALKEFLLKRGAYPIVSACGHSIILEHMAQHNASLGGELSCHFFFKDRGFGFDDGIYAAFRLLEILHNTKKTLHTLLMEFPQKISSKQYRLQCKEDEKKQLINAVYTYFKEKQKAEIVTLDGVHATMPYGWGLIRASNTQPVICFRFESDTYEGLNCIKQDFVNALSQLYPFDTAFDLGEYV